MKMALCMHSPLWAERHLLSWGRCQSWLAVTHLLAGRKEVSIRAVIFSLCSYSNHSMAVGCVSAHRCWCLVHTDTCGTNTAHSVPAGEAPARAQHLCFGLYQVTTINLVMGSFSYHWRYFEVSASMWTQDEHVLSFLFQLWNFCVLALSWLFSSDWWTQYKAFILTAEHFCALMWATRTVPLLWAQNNQGTGAFWIEINLFYNIWHGFLHSNSDRSVQEVFLSLLQDGAQTDGISFSLHTQFMHKWNGVIKIMTRSIFLQA